MREDSVAFLNIEFYTFAGISYYTRSMLMAIFPKWQDGSP